MIHSLIGLKSNIIFTEPIYWPKYYSNDKKMLKEGKSADTYLTHVCRLWLKVPYISSFYRAFSTPVISTDVSQVVSHSSLLFNIFYHFTSPGFPFILILKYYSKTHF